MSPDAARADDIRIDAPPLLQALLARAVRIVAVSVALVGIAYGVLLFVPRVYESSASLVVENAGEVASEIELIRSPELLLEVVDAENLRSLPEFSGIGFSPLDLLLQVIGRRPDPGGIDETVLDNLSARVTVGSGEAGVISIAVRSADPDLAARLANAIAEARLRRGPAAAMAGVAGEGADIAELRAGVAAAEAAVTRFKAENGMPADVAAPDDGQLVVISNRLAEAQQRRSDAQSRAELIRQLVGSRQSLEGVPDIRNSVVIQNLFQSRATLQSELAQRSTTLLANHPTIRSLKAQIAEIEGQIAAEGRRIADSLEAEAKIQADLEQQLTGDLARARSAIEGAGKGATELAGLEREARAQRALLAEALARTPDRAPPAAGAAPVLKLLEAATPSSEPVSPKVPLILATVGILALGLQVGAVLLGTLSSATVRGREPEPELEPELEPTEEDEREALDDAEIERLERDAFPEMPALEEMSLAEDDQLDWLSASVTSQQLRIVLLARLGDDGLQVIDRLLEDAVVAGLSAVAIDAGSGVPSQLVGLTDLAAGEADYGDVLYRSGEDLADVPWGRLATLDRRSDRPLTLIGALSEIYHVVLVDTGRLGVTSALPLFTGAPAAVVLAADGAASAPAIDAARRDVIALGFEVAGTVLLPAARAEVA